MKQILILIAFALTLISCGNYKHIKNPSEKRVVKTETELDFATMQREIITPHCTNCHYHANTYNQYTLVQKAAPEMLERIETGNLKLLMPPKKAPLNDRLKKMFREWVEGGAPEYKKTATNPKPKPVAPVSFQQVKENILKPYNCIACHSQYEDYDTVYRSINSILSQVNSDKMPFPQRRGQSIDPMKKEHKQLLLDWVAQGTPDIPGVLTTVEDKPELKPTWISLRNNVFGPKCILCHNSFSPRGGKKRSMETYSKLIQWMINKESLFHFDKKEGDEPGEFLASMLREPCQDLFCDEQAMPLNTSLDDVPTDIEMMTEEELTIIKKWIDLKLPQTEDDL